MLVGAYTMSAVNYRYYNGNSVHYVNIIVYVTLMHFVQRILQCINLQVFVIGEHGLICQKHSITFKVLYKILVLKQINR